MARGVKQPRTRTTRRSREASVQPVAAAEFKARCLELMDRVHEARVEYVVTKHGTPVAKLVPYAPPGRRAFFGSGAGTVLEYDRPFDPIDGEYDVDRDGTS